MATSAPLNILAWDIECSKQPLKFPDRETDEVILISYMFNGQGYLIVNREWLTADVRSFAFQPKPQFAGAGPFVVFNEKNEKDVLRRFLEHVLRLKPHVLVTYNGDNFDFPFVHRRAQLNGLDMCACLGVTPFERDNAFLGSGPVLHLDAFLWVERDSYLPQGARTLKAVCKAKLRFDPVEVEPEEMVRLAREQPEQLAVYSVSDAVATFYLYERYIHNFILALSSIIPLPVSDPCPLAGDASFTLGSALLSIAREMGLSLSGWLVWIAARRRLASGKRHALRASTDGGGCAAPRVASQQTRAEVHAVLARPQDAQAAPDS